MYKLAIIVFLLSLSGCTKTVIPETSRQFQTVSYAQLSALTSEVYTACQEKLITKETCISLFDKLSSAKVLIDSGLGADQAVSILEYVRKQI